MVAIRAFANKAVRLSAEMPACERIAMQRRILLLAVAIAPAACAAGTIGAGDAETSTVADAGASLPGADAGTASSRIDAAAAGHPDAAAGHGHPDAGAAAAPDSGVTGAAPGHYFPSGAIWYQDVSQAALDSESSAITQWLAGNGGWGLGHLQIDFSIDVLQADPSTPLMNFMPTGDFYTPDCDQVMFPVPPGGNVEGETGYACTGDGDCHLLVVDRPAQKLYEMWRANIVGGSFSGGCAAVWDMSRIYGPSGRGDQCTSADAAGHPITPLLFNADEVAAGTIDHAIRFILPNDRIRQSAYVHPATHGAGSGPDQAVVYGSRWRLQAGFDVEGLPSAGAKVVARALQRYGMFLSDGGNVAFTAQADTHTTAKWAGLLDARDLASIQPTDFEIIDGGMRIPLTDDCVRAP
jgi:serine/threonine-protein kinase